MKSSTILRWCLVLEWIFILACLATDSTLESLLPEPLKAWLQMSAERDPSVGELVFCAVVTPLIVSILVATVGLFCLRRWAAWLYLITSVLATLLMPFTGPSVQHALTHTLDEMAILMSGMVIALAFFTDSLKKKADEQHPPLPSRTPRTGLTEGEL